MDDEIKKSPEAKSSEDKVLSDDEVIIEPVEDTDIEEEIEAEPVTELGGISRAAAKAAERTHRLWESRGSLFSRENRAKTVAVISAAAALIIALICIFTYGSPGSVARRYVTAVIEGDYKTVVSLSAYDYRKMLVSAYDAEATASDYFSYSSDYYDEDIESWKDLYRAVGEAAADTLDDEYGRCKVEVRVTREKELSLKKLASEADLSLYKSFGMDPDDISSSKLMTVKYRISGSDESAHGKYYVYLVKLSGQWKVLDCR